MEEQNNTWEQPQNSPQTGEVENTRIEVEEKSGSLGKFKDSDTLLAAYNSLQAEFTRKCQRLAELEKQKEEQAVQSDEGQTNASIPLYERENWTEIVADFLSKNEEAKAYSKEICAEIMNNKQAYCSEDSLVLAYAKAMKNHYASRAEKINDGDFVENYILNNEEIKDKVMKIYLNELSKNSPPKVLSSAMGEVFSKKENKPKSLEEAKQFVQNILND